MNKTDAQKTRDKFMYETEERIKHALTAAKLIAEKSRRKEDTTEDATHLIVLLARIKQAHEEIDDKFKKLMNFI